MVLNDEQVIKKIMSRFLKFLKPKKHSIPEYMVYDIKEVQSYKYLLFKKSIKRSENNQKYLNDELQSPRKIETRQNQQMKRNPKITVENK